MMKKIIFISLGSLIMLSSLILSIVAFRKYSIDYIDVYVANEEISQRVIIDENVIRKERVPKEYLNDDVYIEEEDIIGKYVKLNHTIPEGSLFYKGFLEKGARDKIYNLLYENQVSYDLYSSDLRANSGSLCNGMYVDIYLTISNKEKPMSDLLIKNARIIGMADYSGRQISNYDYESKADIISLAINKEEVPLLNKALIQGNISIVTNYDTYVTDRYSEINKDSSLIELLG